LTTLPQTFRYAFGGYVLDTNIYLPELQPTIEMADCSIMVNATIPDGVDHATLELPFYHNHETNLLQLKYEKGWIFVKHNKHIEFIPNEVMDEAMLRIYILGTVLAVMSVALNFFPFHASAVVINGKAVLFCGASGVGKSTLAAYFYSKKYTILSEDVTNVKMSANGKYVAYPSLQRIKLSSSGLNLIGADETGLDTIPLKKHKFSYPINLNTATAAYPLGAFVFLQFNGDKPVFKMNLTAESKIRLNRFLFRKRITKNVYDGTYKNANLFNIALNHNSYVFSRPNNEYAMAENCKFIEDKLLVAIEDKLI